MKCSERSDLVKTLLGHPDIDVRIRDNVQPLIMHYFFAFFMSLVPKCTNPNVSLPFLYFQNGKSALDTARYGAQDLLQEYSK